MASFCQIHSQIQEHCGILYLHSVAQVAAQVKQDSVRVQSPMGSAFPSASIMFKVSLTHIHRPCTKT